MHRLIALYNKPADPEHFREYLQKTHLPLVAVFPGLRGMRLGLDLADLTGGTTYFAIVECDFDSAEAMHAALASKEGQAASADVPNYAGAGVSILTYEVKEPL